ncbi:hypothetical protein J2J97_32455 (plasmid) [Rhizobium bangladeshense]|uniref:hypothetical protein n=1 Tax=Rhizobium bangladeshense TaxID=1138189 RepID=UPI001A985773|nr:hypothetical protein [Rhizobium bangladeshense]QSY98618.1 hypothetical protein J2J97_32455 [Rhizobium bangladeshense]
MPTLRIEFIRAAEAKEGITASAAPARCLGSAELPISSTPTATLSRPEAPEGATHAVVISVGGASYVDWDGQKGMSGGSLINADPANGERFYVPSGGTRVFTGFKTGARFACVQATLA